MVSKMIKFLWKHKILTIITLGLTFNFSIGFDFNFNFNGNISIDFKLLVFVSIGYQIVRQITKKIKLSHTR